MNLAALQEEAQALHLSILGGFHPTDGDTGLEGAGTLLMLGPDEPGFWAAFTQSPEWNDRSPDPVDRWSERVIGAWADRIGAIPFYPFGGPPYHPFYTWALRTGRIHASPVNFLVHDVAGLFVSFRGALALPQRIDPPKPPPSPCLSCADQPCRTACPIGALTAEGYDVAACKAYLGTPGGGESLSNGCGVRRSCPVSQMYGRLPVQSAYHMAQFKGAS
ncbi:MAG: ferredoxin [Sulfitobacter sp.]|nr:ferredoxin [Sulfitobacter sp.]